jgi:hypothetical protein
MHVFAKFPSPNKTSLDGANTVLLIKRMLKTVSSGVLLTPSVVKICPLLFNIAVKSVLVLGSEGNHALM